MTHWMHYWRVSCATLIVAAAGCGADPDGPGSYQAFREAQQNAEGTLTAQGAKLERKDYPQGSAWAVDLSGKTIADETLTALKALDRVSELNLSGSTLSDEHMARVNESSTFLMRLDLSKTSVTDQGLAQLEAGFLNDLDVTGSKITEEGVSQFLKKRADNPQIMFKAVNVKK